MVPRRRSASTRASKSGRIATGARNSAFCSRLPAASRKRGCDRRKEAHARLQLLIEPVVRALHPGGAIRALRPAIVLLDVETKTDHRAVSCRELPQVGVHAP